MTIHKVAFYLFALFMIVLTISFSSTLPDPDHTLRLLTASVFVFPFGALILYGIYSKKITFSIFDTSFAPVFILFAVVVITGMAWNKSLSSNDGLFEFIKWTLLLFYLLAFSILSKLVADPMKMVSRTVVLLVYIIQLFGVWQLIGMWNYAHEHKEVFEVSYRLTSLLSNKNSFAEMIALCMPLQVMCIIAESNRWKKAAIVSLVLSLIYLILLKSSSVFVALVLVMIVLSLLTYSKIRNTIAIKFKVRPERINLVTIAALFSSIVGLILVFNKIDGFRKAEIAVSYLKGNTTDVKFNANSVFERMMLWRNSGKLIAENFWTGCGLANWKLLAPKYGFTGANYLTTDNIKFTRPHNDYLQMFAETGIGGFISYVLLLGWGIFMSIKQYLTNKTKENLVLLAGLVTFTIVSFFGFPMEKMLLMVILMTYFSLLIFYKMKESKKHSQSKLVPVALVGFMFFAIYSTNVTAARLNAELQYQQLLAAKEKNKWPIAYRIAKSMDETYFPIDYNATPIAWYKGAAAFMNSQPKEALSYYEEAIALAPYHVQILNDIGAVYMNTGDNNTANNYFNKALEINPRFPDAKFNQAIAVFNKGNKLGAYNLFREVRALHPPAKYADYMIVVIQHVGDSIFRSVGFDPNVNPVWKVKYTGTNLWYYESIAMKQNKSFVQVIRHEIDSIKNNIH
ncbi:MAG TPA: O-antigen ligase family protein [Bacteroidia bacterium]|mgnify:CR=1 FL=1|jgi:O-antigen ligase|nr:O-antigen ligase family protein [Bacteroidia bacterium]HMU19105.1 O-antigen ligase family protein [Bacteroidia bacterium]